MDNKYIINSEVCENLLKDWFGFSSIEDIRAKNSRELKCLAPAVKDSDESNHDPDVVIDNDHGKRIPIPSIPQKSACGTDLCGTEKSANYIDVLYVPSHPETRKKAYYAVTEEAQKAIIEEQERLNDAITREPQETIKNINRLGIFSKFYTSPHEMFLDGQNKLRYRFFLNAEKTLTSGAAKKYKDDGENGFVYALAKKEGLDVDKELEQYAKAAARSDLYQQGDRLSEPNFSNVEDFLEQVDELAKQDEYIAKAYVSLKKDVLSFINKKIAEYDSTAEKKARLIETDDGSKYVYDKDKHYFTSEVEKKIEKSFETIFNKAYFFEEKDLIFCNHEFVLRILDKFYSDIANVQEKIKNKDFELNQYSWQEIQYEEDLSQLNAYGYLIKEQCLSMEQLEGTKEIQLGSKKLKEHYSDWRDNAWFSEKGIPIDINDSDYITDDILKELSIDKNKTFDIKNQKKKKR